MIVRLIIPLFLFFIFADTYAAKIENNKLLKNNILPIFKEKTYPTKYFSAKNPKEALEFAWENSHSIKTARENTNAIYGEVLKSKSAIIPKISAVWQASAAQQELTGIVSKGTSLKIDMDFPIYSGLLNSNKVLSANEELKFRKYEYSDKRSEIFKNIIESFVKTKIQEKLVALNSKSINYMKKLLDFVRAQMRLGVKTKADVKGIEARLAGAKASFFGSIAAMESSKAQFRAIANCSISPGSSYGKFIGFLFGLLPKNLPQLQKEAINNSAKIKAANHQYLAIKKNLMAAKASFGPNIAGKVSYGFYGQAEGVSGSVTASIPIFDIQIHGNYKTIKHREAAARNKKLNEIENVKSTCVRYWQEILSMKKSTQALQKQVLAASDALENQRQSFELGYASTTEVLKAEDQLYDAERKLLENEAKLLSAILGVLYVSNKLTPEVLQLKNLQLKNKFKDIIA